MSDPLIAALPLSFADTLEVVESLPVEDQEEIVAILRRRLSAQRRAEIIESVRESREDFEAGRYRVVTPEELTREIFS